MSEKDSPRGGGSSKIRLLRESVARRIAAGEVIDRPYSAVRELLDNAIDSGADTIRLDLENGGIGAIRCGDNGGGMNREDLELCFLPHATSKISEVDDLYSLKTMGFRGEALSSLAACSRLEILSRPFDAPSAWRLKVLGGKTVSLDEDRGGEGTTVSVEDLFYSLPGRKKFLKSPGSEGTLCKNAFIEKSLPFPEIEFRYFADGKLKLFLPRGNLKDRAVQAYPRLLDPKLVHLFEGKREELGYSIAATGPSLYRRDRRYIQIYVNRRRVTEYALTQAVEYGFRDILPGGCFPYAFIFLDVPPAAVDFNIHPSKKEVRFRDLPGIHKLLVETIHHHLADLTGRRMDGFGRMDRLSPSDEAAGPRDQGTERPEQGELSLPDSAFPRPPRRGYADSVSSAGWSAESSRRNLGTGEYGSRTEAVPFKRWQNELSPMPVLEGEITGGGAEDSTDPGGRGFRYMGQIMNLFLLAEKGDSLYLIDQHAAHERILYDEAENLWSRSQELLVPLIMDFDAAEERVFESRLEEYHKLGFTFSKEGEGRWQMLTLPSLCDGMEDEIVPFFTETRGDVKELKKKLHATISCRRAVKDGEVLDSVTARELVRKTFELNVPRCPHGRPVWFTLSREELYRLVGRDF